MTFAFQCVCQICFGLDANCLGPGITPYTCQPTSHIPPLVKSFQDVKLSPTKRRHYWVSCLFIFSYLSTLPTTTAKFALRQRRVPRTCAPDKKATISYKAISVLKQLTSLTFSGSIFSMIHDEILKSEHVLHCVSCKEKIYDFFKRMASNYATHDHNGRHSLFIPLVTAC